MEDVAGEDIEEYMRYYRGTLEMAMPENQTTLRPLKDRIKHTSPYFMTRDSPYLQEATQEKKTNTERE